MISESDRELQLWRGEVHDVIGPGDVVVVQRP